MTSKAADSKASPKREYISKTERNIWRNNEDNHSFSCKRAKKVLSLQRQLKNGKQSDLCDVDSGQNDSIFSKLLTCTARGTREKFYNYCVNTVILSRKG